MSIKDYIHIEDSVIPAGTISKFLEYINQCSDDFEAGLIIGDKNPESVKKYRDVEIKNLSVDPFNFTQTHWFNLMEYAFRKGYSIKIPHASFGIINTIQILKYSNNGHYKWHTDHSLEVPRSISAIFILNNDYEGGELSFKDQITGEQFTIENKPGRLIMWPSNFIFPHSVAPVTKGMRYSIVLWAL